MQRSENDTWGLELPIGQVVDRRLLIVSTSISRIKKQSPGGVV